MDRTKTLKTISIKTKGPLQKERKEKNTSDPTPLYFFQ